MPDGTPHCAKLSGIGGKYNDLRCFLYDLPSPADDVNTPELPWIRARLARLYLDQGFSEKLEPGV